jgi:competence ComEA-like helix-hairpin-helix protein
MKKSRHKEESSLQAADHLPKKSGAENILVFLVLAIILLAASVYSTQRQLQLKNTPPSTAKHEGRYVWLTGAPGFNDGLHLFTEQQIEENFPGMDLFPPGETALGANSPVVAIQYHDTMPRQVSLPPALANIFFQPIPINRADADILTSLPGIGPVLADRIVQRRDQHGPFRTKDELLHITGIGPKKLDGIVDHITFE